MRPIDGDALKERIQSLAYDDWNQGVSTTWANAYSEVADMIDDFPTADVQEVKRGSWIDTGSGQECPFCGEIQYGYDSFRRYCTVCGADNREDGK